MYNIIDINRVKSELLIEAQTSPKLLSDLAGLESYISESYNNRSFIELLRNADDAHATKFTIQRYGNYLLVANNGNVFTDKDIESLCRSASSNKARGTTIGYRGIGFKSVVSLAKEIHLVSGSLEMTFSKSLTRELVPNATNVPLIRIPHNIRKEVKTDLEIKFTELIDNGYTTIFIFAEIEANNIEEEFLSFSHTSLLFLNNILEIDISLKEDLRTKTIKSIEVGTVSKVRLTSPKDYSEWYVYSHNNSSIAFSVIDNKVVKIPKNKALIHAFLPTEDSCGLGVLINGDFSTDPSRRHLIYDDSTNSVINIVAELYINLFKNIVSNSIENSQDFIDALIPYYDIRMLQFSKNLFERRFGDSIKKLGGSYFSPIIMSPNWLNPRDFNIISTKKNDTIINEGYYQLLNFIPLMKYLGTKEATIDYIVNRDVLSDIDITVLACVQIAQASIKKVLLGADSAHFKDVNIFYAHGDKKSLNRINNNGERIDDSFLNLLYEKGVTQSEVKVVLKKLGLSALSNAQFPVEEQVKTLIPELKLGAKKLSSQFETNEAKRTSVAEWYNNITTDKYNSSENTLSLKRWRSAEEQTRNILNKRGFRLEDVSKQNLGYDLEGYDLNNNKVYIEVKSINYAGQKFRMTNNEFGVAQINKDNYYIAMVLQENNELQISLIKDPTTNLTLTRQCVQWIWECSDYNYKPITFKLEEES